MNELIKITRNEQGQQLVSARELHEGLKINSNFTTWFKRMCEYGFEEQEDFIPFLEESNGGRPQKDYVITLDMAKEISMLQRNELGKKFRQYFIECEKQLKEQRPQLPTDYLTALKALVESEEEKQRLLQVSKEQAIQLQEQAPKVKAYEEFMDADGLYTITNVSKILELRPKKEVFPYLRAKGLILSNNLPSQSGIERGLFKIKVIKGYNTTKVTPKGLEWIRGRKNDILK